MADGLVPRIIVLALGAGVLGFPDVLRAFHDVAGRSPLTDVAICVLAVAVITAQALGAMLLSRFVRKARAAGARPPPRADRFAQVTLVVSLGVAFLVSACLLAASGAAAGSLALLQAVADVAREMKSPVVAVLATAAAVLPCARTLLRVFRQEEDHSHGGGAAAAASSSTATGRFASMTTQVASFTGAVAFLLLLAVSSGGLYIQPGSLVSVSIGAAAIVGTMLVALFTRKARNAAGAGGRAAPASTSESDTRRVGGNGKLTRLPPYLAVVAFAVLCCLVLTTTKSGPDGAKYLID